MVNALEAAKASARRWQKCHSLSLLSFLTSAGIVRAAMEIACLKACVLKHVCFVLKPGSADVIISWHFFVVRENETLVRNVEADLVHICIKKRIGPWMGQIEGGMQSGVLCAQAPFLPSATLLPPLYKLNRLGSNCNQLKDEVLQNVDGTQRAIIFYFSKLSQVTVNMYEHLL